MKNRSVGFALSLACALAVTLCAHPAGAQTSGAPRPQGASPNAVDIRWNGIEIGPLDHLTRSISFDDGGVRKHLTMERLRGKAGPLVLDDAFYAAMESSEPAKGGWVAKDGDRYRFIDVRLGPDNKPSAIVILPPETVGEIIAQLKANIGFVAESPVYPSGRAPPK